jgi:hypothetical protein
MSEKSEATDISINLTEYVLPHCVYEPEQVSMQCFGPFEQRIICLCHYEYFDACRAFRGFRYSVTVTLSLR